MKMLFKVTLGRCKLAKSVGRISVEGLSWQNLLAKSLLVSRVSHWRRSRSSPKPPMLETSAEMQTQGQASPAFLGKEIHILRPLFFSRYFTMYHGCDENKAVRDHDRTALRKFSSQTESLLKLFSNFSCP